MFQSCISPLATIANAPIFPGAFVVLNHDELFVRQNDHVWQGERSIEGELPQSSERFADLGLPHDLVNLFAFYQAAAGEAPELEALSGQISKFRLLYVQCKPRQGIRRGAYQAHKMCIMPAGRRVKLNGGGGYFPSLRHTTDSDPRRQKALPHFKIRNRLRGVSGQSHSITDTLPYIDRTMRLAEQFLRGPVTQARDRLREDRVREVEAHVPTPR